MGSPPAQTSKNEVEHDLSESTMVMAPARTGITPMSNAAVIATAHGYSDVCKSVLCTLLAYRVVTNRLIAPVRELPPAACREMRNTSTDSPAWDPARDSGGYTVHAVPAPSSIHELPTMSRYASTSNHIPRLFTLGNMSSGTHICIGTRRLPNPDMTPGMMKKNIMSMACDVVKVL